MPQRRSHVTSSAAQGPLARRLRALREEIGAPTAFPTEALAEATATQPEPPARDLRDIPFATLDPAGSRDLDQAFHISRTASGFRVRYAIADLPSFVRPGGAVDRAARERGQTLYAADGVIPLHPPLLSEDRASLLPGVDRPALVWEFTLDADGMLQRTGLERAMIRSRAQLDYTSAQAALDSGEDTPVMLLPRVGTLLQKQEAARGGASLNLPDEDVVRLSDGSYEIRRRHPLPLEDANAQLSLLTGMAAAVIMLEAKVGILRTMPQPDDGAFAAFRRQTEALGRPWRTGRYGDYLRSLEHDDPAALSVMQAAASLFRGAGYAAFDGVVPTVVEQAAIAAPYAHATAPLRRLVDRWVLTICLAVVHGHAVPDWVRESLPEVPSLMGRSAQRAGTLNARTLDLVEAALLEPRIGHVFDAIVIMRNGERGRVQIADPPVTAALELPETVRAGTVSRVRLTAVDVDAGDLSFEVVDAVGPFSP